MSIRDLRTFLAIADGGSFAAAAKRVGRTQSAITVQMRTLEDEIGAPLFDRTKRPPVLNERGRALVGRAAEVVAAYDRLFQEAGGSALQGDLRLGVVPSVITGLLPAALAALRARYPGLHVELAMGLSKDLVERVHRGTLDAAIVSDLLEGGAGLSWSPFVREPLVLIAPLDAPARKAEELVTAYPFIRYTRQAWVGQLIDRFLKKRGLRVEAAMTLDTLEAITTMVHHGLGVSVVPLRTTGDSTGLAVRTVPFAGPTVNRVIGLVSAPNHPKALLAEILLDTLKATAASGEGAKSEASAGRSRGRRRAGAT